MKSGVFHVPYLRPERTARQVFDYSVLLARESDRAGFVDFMIGEHATQSWECIPNPELVIAACARETDQIRFGPMAHLLPLHQPASLAIQIGWLSQILEGRYFLGIGSGAYPRDAVLRGQPADMSESHPRRLEAIEIMRKVWERKPFEFRGTYFDAGFPEEDSHGDVNHRLPNFAPWGGRDNLEIAMTAISERSPSMRYAGEQGFSPILFFGGIERARGLWDTYEQGASSRGLPADRDRVRIVFDVAVADTDEEAKKLAIDGGMGVAWTNYLLPIYRGYGLLENFIADSGTTIDPADIDLEWLAEHVWIVGSAQTVTAKIERLNEAIGGFGELVITSYDYIDDPKPWIESMRQIADEVIPAVKPLG